MAFVPYPYPPILPCPAQCCYHVPQKGKKVTLLSCFEVRDNPTLQWGMVSLSPNQMISLFCDLGFLVINGDLTSQTRERQGAAIYWDWSEGEWELLLIHSLQLQLPSCNLACNLTFLAQVAHFCLQTYFIHIMSVDTVDCTVCTVHTVKSAMCYSDFEYHCLLCWSGSW